MIPLITHTPRLQILAASRALLTAELQKPHYFPALLGAVLPADWSTAQVAHSALEQSLELLTAGGRDTAGWYGWYALRKADDAVILDNTHLTEEEQFKKAVKWVQEVTQQAVNPSR